MTKDTQNVFNLIGAIYIELNSQNVVTRVNDYACRVLEYSENEIIGENWFEKFVPKSGNPELFHPATKTDEFYEKPVITKTGVERLISWRKTEIKENDQLRGYVCVGEDITAHENYIFTLHQISSLFLQNSNVVPYKDFIKLVAEAANSNHSYIFLNSADEKSNAICNKFCEWGNGKYIEEEEKDEILQNFRLSDLHVELARKLESGLVIHKSTNNFPDSLREFLYRYNIKAILLIPIMIESRFFGFVGFDNRANEREWTYSEIEFLKASVKSLEQKIILTKADEALRNEHARFQATMDAIEVIIFVTNFKSNKVIYANSFAYRTFGDVLGKTTPEILKTPHFIHSIGYQKDDLIKDNQLSNSFKEEVESVGGNKSYSVQTKAVKWTNGKWVRLETIIDITEKKNTEKRILDSEYKFKKLSSIAVEGVIIHDKGKIIEINKAALDMAQYPYQEVIGKNITDLVVAPESHSLVKQKMMEVNPKPYEIIGVRKDGENIPLEIHAKNVTYDGENLRVVAIRDISERKRVEKELILQRNRAEESNNLKTQFLNNLSHEIRTPLNGIVGFSQLLNDPKLTEENRRHFRNIIQNSSLQLSRIIEDLIEISILETKQISPLFEEVNLNTLLHELFSIFELKSKEKGVKLLLQNGLPDEGSWIITDKTKLSKVLNNLVENALKFTTKGKVEIGYALVDEKIKIWVEDTGIGIEKIKQNLIFDRFSQAGKSTSKEFGGLGLGLSIAKENMELLNGAIKVESKMNKGSKFSILLPYKQGFEPKIKKDKASSNFEFDFKVLIAEDEEVNYTFLEFILKNMESKINIVRAKNGKEAMALFSGSHDFDLIFMDLKMPQMDGIKAAKLIKQKNPMIPIIAITAYSSKEERDLALNVGCDDILTKPVSVDKFKEMCQFYFRSIKK